MLSCMDTQSLMLTTAGSDFLLSDQESDVYYRFALVAGTEIKVDKDAEVTGNLHSNGKIDLKKNVLVTGDVSAVGKIKNKGSVTGTVTEGAAALGLPAPHATCLLKGLCIISVSGPSRERRISTITLACQEP